MTLLIVGDIERKMRKQGEIWSLFEQAIFPNGSWVCCEKRLILEVGGANPGVLLQLFIELLGTPARITCK